MDYLKKLGYLKGLTAGLSLGKDTPEQKVLYAIIDVLDEMADALRDAEDAVSRLETELETVSDDLDELSDNVEEFEDGISEFTRLFAENINPDDREPIKLFPDDDDDDEDDDDDDDDEEYNYAVSCPVCEHEFVLTEEMLADGGVNCPSCKERLEFDIHTEDDSCDCGHHHHHHEDEE